MVLDNIIESLVCLNLKSELPFSQSLAQRHGIVYENKWVAMDVSEINSQIIDKVSLQASLSKNKTVFLSAMKESECHHSKLPDECLALLSMRWETALKKSDMEHLNINENDIIESIEDEDISTEDCAPEGSVDEIDEPMQDEK